MEINVETLIDSIKKRIAEYEAIADDLAHGYIQSDKPFPDDNKRRYEAVGNIVEGLQEVINILLLSSCEEVKTMQLIEHPDITHVNRTGYTRDQWRDMERAEHEVNENDDRED